MYPVVTLKVAALLVIPMRMSGIGDGVGQSRSLGLQFVTLLVEFRGDGKNPAPHFELAD